MRPFSSPALAAQAGRAHALHLLGAALLVVAVLLLAGTHSLQPATAAGAGQPDVLRLNHVGAFPLKPGVKCADLTYPQIGLEVAGMDTGLKAIGCQDQPVAVLMFEFRPVAPDIGHEGNRAAWRYILEEPLRTPHGRDLPYRMRAATPAGSVDLADGMPPRRLQIFDWRAPFAFALVVAVWYLLIYLGIHTGLLRDRLPGVDNLLASSFSLGRSQLAWWFAIIFACFLFLWLVTGEIPSLSTQALGLIGISGLTTVTSVQVGLPPGTAAKGSQGFFRDLLSDTNGVKVERFQMLVFTVTLGLMFLFKVASTLTMPDLDPSLLALMGISAGTYVAAKMGAQSGDPKPEATPVGAPTAQTALPAPGSGNPKDGYTPTP